VKLGLGLHPVEGEQALAGVFEIVADLVRSLPGEPDKYVVDRGREP
jgi:hypothetical protein